MTATAPWQTGSMGATTGHTAPEQLLDAATARAWSATRARSGERVVLVPTMGALHDGHQRLVEVAHRHGDAVVVSIFVNPLQFERDDDFAAYPQTLDDDLALCAAAGVHAVYAPTAASMYPAGFQTTVEVTELTRPLEGAGRPGHFRGVTTVVTKLFHAVRPDAAVFGMKDYQQLLTIERLVTDLDLGIEIVRVPTVREGDGLALSSRNRRLGAADRSAATCIPGALAAARQAIDTGVRDTSEVLATARRVLDAEPRARVEYLELVDAATLQPVANLDRPSVLATAVWFGDVRLIDNEVFGLDVLD